MMRGNEDEPSFDVSEEIPLEVIIELVESDGIIYSSANKRKVLGSLRKIPAIYGIPSSNVFLSVKSFSERWGKGVIKRYPISFFSSSKSFQNWRSNCRAAISSAECIISEGTEAKDIPEWSEFLEIFDSLSGHSARGAKYHFSERMSHERSAKIGREAGVPPQEMTMKIYVEARAAAASVAEKEMIVRSAARFDTLRGDPLFRHLTPSNPVGPLPRLRDLDYAAWERLPECVRQEWADWLEARSTQHAPLSGASTSHSKEYVSQQHSAIRWYVRIADGLGLIDPGTIFSLKDLASTATLSALVQDEAQRRERGEKALQVTSVQSYVKALKRLFEELGIDVSAYYADPLFREGKGLAPRTKEFAKALLRDPKLRRRYFLASESLRAEAEKSMAAGNHNSVIRFGVASFSMMLLTRIVPLRRANASGLRSGGDNCHFNFDRNGHIRGIHIPARETKNRKTIDVELNPGRSRDALDECYEWFCHEIRPLMLERCKTTTSIHVFPSRNGKAIGPDAWSQWMQRSLATIGLPITPHMVRHATATLLLDRHPDMLTAVSALLGDEPKTVLERYSYIDKLKHVASAQSVLFNDFFDGRKTPRHDRKSSIRGGKRDNRIGSGSVK